MSRPRHHRRLARRLASLVLATWRGPGQRPDRVRVELRRLKPLQLAPTWDVFRWCLHIRVDGRRLALSSIAATRLECLTIALTAARAGEAWRCWK